MNLALNLAELTARVRAAEVRYQREPGSVRLLGASKGQSIDRLRAAVDVGLTIFGENYLQEALDKIQALPSHLEWHFIGPIQRNKTKKIAEHFAWVQSVDSLLIAERLNEQRPKHLPPLNICIEVNIDDETSKSGVKMSEVAALATACQALPSLRLRGLMAIPAPAESVEEQRTAFRKLAALKQQLNHAGFSLDTLSMGMSDDFEAAIAEGSTLIRLGTALFGPRQNPRINRIIP